MGRKTLKVSRSTERKNCLDGSISVSWNVAADKEAPHSEYQTWDSGSGEGVLPGVLDMVFQRRTAAAAAAGNRNEEGKKVGGGS